MEKIKILTSDYISLENCLNRIGRQNIISICHKEIVGIKPQFLVIYLENE